MNDSMKRSRGNDSKPSYYDILQVDQSSDANTLKKSYMKLAKKWHPDKNPTPEAAEKFKEISHAYDVLSNPEKRKLYDEYGEEGLQGGGGASADDIFGSIFGDIFGGRRRGPQGPRRSDDMVYSLGVSLKDLYNGKTTKLKVTKNVTCDKCEGKGSKKDGAEVSCQSCRGRGVKVTVRQLGPGMLQQMQSVCTDCQGKGEVISEKDRCKQCQGKKVLPEQKILEVNIDKGIQFGDKITFAGESNQVPGLQTGDIIIVLQEKKDEPCAFSRHGDDLVVEKKLTLSEALTGYKFILTHLDERQLVVSSASGDIVTPGDVRVIENEGMPHKRNPFLKGRLFIKFTIDFPTPENLSEDVRKQLANLLPHKPTLPQELHPEHEEVTAKYFDPRQKIGGAAGHKSKDATDSDEEEEGRSGCVHQ